MSAAFLRFGRGGICGDQYVLCTGTFLESRCEMVTKKPFQSRLSLFGSNLDSTVHSSHLHELTINGEPLQSWLKHKPKDGVWWLDVTNSSEVELDDIAKTLSIPPTILTDHLRKPPGGEGLYRHQYRLQCLEFFPETQGQVDGVLDSRKQYIVISDQCVLSFAFCCCPHATKARKRISGLHGHVALNGAWIYCSLLKSSTDTFDPIIQNLRRRTESIEDSVLVARTEDSSLLLRTIGKCHRDIAVFARILTNTIEAIKDFTNTHDARRAAESTGPPINEIQAHVANMTSELEQIERHLGRCHSNFLVQLSSSSLVSGNRAKQALCKITLVATILIPLNVICGLFGMNVIVPGKYTSGLQWFFGILGVNVVIFCVACKNVRLKLT